MIPFGGAYICVKIGLQKKLAALKFEISVSAKNESINLVKKGFSAPF